MPDYNKIIADTAKELIHAMFTEEEHYEFLRSKLSWMIDAEKFGWNPDDFEPCCLH